MRIGVVSDTHDNLRNVARIVELFNTARVDRVIHTGDITLPNTLEVFARLEAPLHGVFGNNDADRDALESTAENLGFSLVEPPLRLQWAGRELTVVHDPYAHRDHELGPLLLHGHHHRRRIERAGDGLIFNPGESAGLIEGGNAVGVIDLIELATEILDF